MSGAEHYLTSHGVDLDLAKEAGVRWDDGNIFFRYEPVQGSAYERTRSLFDGICRQPAGKPLDLYWPLGQAQKATILLCEGESDALAAASVLDGSDHPMLHGLCPVGVPGASAPANRMARHILELKCGPVYLALDPDEAGQKATDRWVLALERIATRAIPVQLPEGNDLADCLVEQGDDAENWLANLLADHEAAADTTFTVQRAVKEMLAR